MSKLINPYHYYNDLLLWLDGDDINGNENASDPTNGSLISQWYDKSINGYIFTSSGNDRPTYDSVNRKVGFDGTQHMSADMTNFPTDQFHMIVVASLDIVDDGESDCILSGTTGDGLGNFSFVKEFPTDGASSNESYEVAPVFKFINSTPASNEATQANSIISQAGAGYSASNNLTQASVDPAGGTGLTAQVLTVNSGNGAVETYKITNYGSGYTSGDIVTMTGGSTSFKLKLLQTSSGDGEFRIFEVLAGSSAQGTYVDVNNNGDLSSSVNTTNDGVASLAVLNEQTTINLMKRHSTPGNEAKGTIHEVLMFNALLPKEDRLAIQGYLKHKYALANTTLLPGADIASVAYTAHPFITNAPKTNQPITVDQGNNTVRNTPDLFDGMHKKNPKVPMTFIRMSLDENELNSDATHGDGVESRGGLKQYYFSQEAGDTLARFVPLSFPTLKSVSPTPIEIVPTKGISLRGNVTIKLGDFVRGDDTVSFFSKFLAQNPYYLGRRIEIFEGFVDDSIMQNSTGGVTQNKSFGLQFFDGRREYIIDSMHLNKNVLTIKAKDPLQLGDDLKSKIPTPSQFSTNTIINNTGGLHTLNLRLDNTTQTTSTISATGFALFQSTFDVHDVSIIAPTVSTVIANSSSTVKITANSHGLSNGDRIVLASTSSGPSSGVDINGTYSISNVNTNDFEITVAGVTDTEVFHNGFETVGSGLTDARAVSTTKAKITVLGHPFVNGERVTLSGFGTGSSSSVNINASYTISDVDTDTFQVTKSGLTNTETFSTSSGRVRKNGFARINEEIFEYAGIKTGTVGVDAAVQLEIINRAEWGSVAEEHEVGDSIQNCFTIGSYTDTSLGKTIDDVAFDFLVNRAGVPSRAIETRAGQIYSWSDEKDTWLSAFKVNAILSEPKEVNKQLANLASSVGVNFWWDDNAAKILLKADTPILDKSELQTIDDNDIILDSFNLINSEKERISRVFYYYGIKNHTEDRDKPKNFKNLYVAIDGDSESSAQYGVESNKVMFNWGISDTSTATSVSQRTLQRFKNTPITCQFDVDSSIDYLKTGDHFFLQTRHILNPNGTEKENIEMQVLAVTYDSSKQTNRIKAKTFRFVGNTLSRITVNIDTINAAGSGYSATNTLSQASTTGSGTGMTVTVNTVNSGAVQTYIVTDYGQGHDTGDVVTFNGGNSDFKLNINRGFFPQEGTGSGTESDSYLGDRATNAYISCDSAIATANGGADSRVFISTSIVSAGSGYANGTHAFTGTEIQGATRGSGLVLSVVVSGNSVTGVSVTSNPASGSERAETSHKGYLDNEVLNLVGHSGTNAQIKITVSAKMSTGGEAYLIA